MLDRGPEDTQRSDINLDELKEWARSHLMWVIVGGAFLLLFILAALQGNADSITGVIAAVGLFVLYFLPAIIARKKHNSGSVFVINLFFGWTVIGWIIALAMAANNPPTPRIDQQQPPAQTRAGRTCPFCAEDIRPAAVVCKHCGRDLPAS